MHSLLKLFPIALVLTVLTAAAAAQNAVDVSGAELGGGNPVGARFECTWTLHTDYDEVELTFQLVRSDSVIASSGAFYYQSSGTDTFVIQFSQSAMLGDEIRVTAKFDGTGQTTVTKYDMTEIE